jgi:hypothetical protein
VVFFYGFAADMHVSCVVCLGCAGWRVVGLWRLATLGGRGWPREVSTEVTRAQHVAIDFQGCGCI